MTRNTVPLRQSGSHGTNSALSEEAHARVQLHDTLQSMVDSTREDVQAIEDFYHVNFSSNRIQRLQDTLEDRLSQLERLSFDQLSHEDQTDHILLQKYCLRQLDGLSDFVTLHSRSKPLLEPFSSRLVDLLEIRQRVTPISGKTAAETLARADVVIQQKQQAVADGSLKLEGEHARFAAFNAVHAIDELCLHLEEWLSFYRGYDPTITWWVVAPHGALIESLRKYSALVRKELVGIDEEDNDAIVGQPIGRTALLNHLDAAFIAYTPEELIKIGEQEYSWCETQMKKASHDLGYGDDWKAALEHVKNEYVEPGQQTQLVHQLSKEAIDYVKTHNMVTIPKIAEECWRTYMMPPEQQKVNPFFLGGPYIQVSYPTDTMSHSEKLMSMRGNNRPMSRSTVFHELIPGHHLQCHMMARHRSYRNLFTTAAWIEGWAFYWEFILWDRGFAATPDEKIGMLFWRMHRCARIVFSLSFHMGRMTPQECIDYLVEKVGHERATAEGEVRRSFNGEYGPLYQAGYMIGALQFYKLREEVLGELGWSEKQFHDWVLREGQMPLEILRALLKGEKLERDHKASWRFYDFGGEGAAASA
ncbi:protein of unknown function (DUF885) [Teratosphaeria destructans]|uniref:X-Pro dipeptidyl-peptidase n=1 Tax=Teratosphaeria destructans TaxID=418781 RepID=A0A9W7SV21_9PEZI|nr:protein of unknown function (DUF885) [Teratosphaeria destructans]